MEHPVRPQYWLIILIASIFLAGCWLHYQRGVFVQGPRSLSAQGVDDAYISYRYGWNLAQHGILAWNESRYRRVEGFTNPLWVYFSAVWSLLGEKTWVYPLMTAMSSLLTALLVVGLTTTVQKDFPGQPAAVLGILLAVATPVTWLHTTNGLESGVFAASLAWLAYLAILSEMDIKHKGFWLAMLTGLVCLLRSDGFLYAGMVLCASCIARSRTSKLLVYTLAISTFILFSWRWLSFGTLLPNTYLVKVNFSLIDRLPVAAALLGSVLVISGLPFYWIIGSVGMNRMGRRRLLGGLFFLLAWLGYYFYMGGDYFLDRHLIGMIFFLGAASAPLWVYSRAKIRVLVTVVLLAGIWVSSTMVYNRFDYRTKKDRDPWVMLGIEIEKDRQRFGVLVTSMAGKLPYYAGGDCVDSYGLNDPDLAKLQFGSFFPGHSSGSLEEATKIALRHPIGYYTLSTNFMPELIKKPEMVALWLDTRDPQETVQTTVTPEEWDLAVSANDKMIWSFVTSPLYEPIILPEP